MDSLIPTEIFFCETGVLWITGICQCRQKFPKSQKQDIKLRWEFLFVQLGFFNLYPFQCVLFSLQLTSFSLLYISSGQYYANGRLGMFFYLKEAAETERKKYLSFYFFTFDSLGTNVELQSKAKISMFSLPLFCGTCIQ